MCHYKHFITFSLYWFLTGLTVKQKFADNIKLYLYGTSYTRNAAPTVSKARDLLHIHCDWIKHKWCMSACVCKQSESSVVTFTSCLLGSEALTYRTWWQPYMVIMRGRVRQTACVWRGGIFVCVFSSLPTLSWPWGQRRKCWAQAASDEYQKLRRSPSQLPCGWSRVLEPTTTHTAT